MGVGRYLILGPFSRDYGNCNLDTIIMDQQRIQNIGDTSSAGVVA